MRGRRRWHRPAARAAARPRRAACRAAAAGPGRRRVRRPAHAARGQQPRQQRVHAGLLEREGGARRHVAGHGCGHHRDSSRRRLIGAAPARGQASARRCAGAGARWRRCVRRTGSGWRAAAAAPARRSGRRPAPPGLGPGRPVFGQRRAAQARVDDQVGRRRRGPGLGPQPLSHRLLTVSRPCGLAPGIQRVGVQRICTSFCSRRHRRAAVRAGSQGRRCGRSRGPARRWPVGQRPVRQIPARRRAP
jgi:hypothetical protein